MDRYLDQYIRWKIEIRQAQPGEFQCHGQVTQRGYVLEESRHSYTLAKCCPIRTNRSWKSPYAARTPQRG